jgi:hypothetical protein
MTVLKNGAGPPYKGHVRVPSLSKYG